MVTKDNIEILTLDHYLYLKEQDFEFEGQSYLFWEYVRILKELKPKYFLLENVIMIEKWKTIISKTLDIKPIRINSRLLSAQNRDRYYWTNIYSSKSGLFYELVCHIPLPKDKGILLKDIIENEVDEKYYLKDNSFIFDRINKRHEFTPRIPSLNDKSNTCKVGGSGVDDLIEVKGCDYRYDDGFRVTGGGSNCLPAKNHNDNSSTPLVSINKNIRRLTPIECERLQTVPDNYTNYVSDSQRYKMLGNGWTIDVIAHILSFLNK